MNLCLYACAAPARAAGRCSWAAAAASRHSSCPPKPRHRPRAGRRGPGRPARAAAQPACSQQPQPGVPGRRQDLPAWLAQRQIFAANAAILLALACLVAVLLPSVLENAQLLHSGAAHALATDTWQVGAWCSTKRLPWRCWPAGCLPAAAASWSWLLTTRWSAQELLQDVFAFTGLTTLFVNIEDPLSGLAHATGACLFMALLTQVQTRAHRAPACMRRRSVKEHSRHMARQPPWSCLAAGLREQSVASLCCLHASHRRQRATRIALECGAPCSFACRVPAGLHGRADSDGTLSGHRSFLRSRRCRPGLQGPACGGRPLAGWRVGGLE